MLLQRVYLRRCCTNIRYLGGVLLKTLFIYYTNDDTVGELCRKSASVKTDVCELRDLSGGSFAGRILNAVRGVCTDISGVAADAGDYESIVFAFDGRFGVTPSALNTFIRDNDLRYKKIYSLIFGEGRAAKHASDSFKSRVSLSGGTVSSTVHVPVRQFKDDEEDALYFVRHSLTV